MVIAAATSRPLVAEARLNRPVTAQRENEPESSVLAAPTQRP